MALATLHAEWRRPEVHIPSCAADGNCGNRVPVRALTRPRSSRRPSQGATVRAPGLTGGRLGATSAAAGGSSLGALAGLPRARDARLAVHAGGGPLLPRCDDEPDDE